MPALYTLQLSYVPRRRVAWAKLGVLSSIVGFCLAFWLTLVWVAL